MSKSNEEKYAAEFAKWRAEDRGQYDAPGYAENPRAAREFLLRDPETSTYVWNEDFWPADTHIELKGSSNRPLMNAKGCSFDMAHKDDELFYIRVCDFFTALGSGEDEATGESVLVLRSLDARKAVRTITLPRGIIAQGDKTLAAHCQARGFNITSDKRGRIWLQHLLTNLHGPRLRLPTK